MHFLVPLIIVIAVLVTVSWLKRLPPSQRSAAGLKAGLATAGVLLLLALLTGRVSITAAIVMMVAAIPMIQRLMGAKSLFDRLKSGGRPTAGNTSTVNTRFVEMTLDHDSGEMTGNVTEGVFAGRSLVDLKFEELMELIAECRDKDAQSAAVLEAYLDRYHGESWRAGQTRSETQPPGGAGMSRKEACEILGVPPEAKRKEILAAHRRLMQKLHPDRGGSDYLAAKINQAKDFLLAD